MKDRFVRFPSLHQVSSMALAAGLMLLSSSILIAEDYAQALAVAVDQHQNGARDAALELGIVEELNALSEKSETAWLPDYWAAYILTQIARSHDEDRQERVERAQSHLDRAQQRSANDRTAPTADLHALQSLIHEFKMRGTQDKEERARLRAAADSELATAFDLDPESPVVMVHAATDSISSGNSDRDWSRVMAGLALLHQAEARFIATKQPRGLTSHYNSEWIKPWADWVYRLYEGGFDAE